MRRVFFFSIADSDPGTGSTGYREVFDKAQAVRTLLTEIQDIADSDQGTGSTGYREVFDKAQAVRTQS
jgi:hypothetical protein